jgi:1,3-beta-galactosyl-N-acetylhexosamine phosphorylase
MKLSGHFTLPAQSGMDEEVRHLCDKWRVDAIRDSDGTTLSPELMNMDLDVYSTICLIRADQNWAKSHGDHCQQKFLMSFPITCRRAGKIVIEVLKGYSHEQYLIDTVHDPKRYWEVIDRTAGDVVDINDWSYDIKRRAIIIHNCKNWHVYTVNFLVYQIWETTSMYNHITNKWTGDHKLGVDPRQPETRRHLLNYLDRWLVEHPDTDCVRFTSMFYQFPLIKNDRLQNVYLDWSGYLDSMSALALDEFAKHFGYRLRSEDIVDEGYFNASYRIPRKPYLDWMRFTQDFVRDLTKECVDRVHNSGKKAVLFFCDHWIGVEPYLDGFEDLGFDGIVGPCLSGVELRRIADVPGKSFKEVRLYPYFFEVNLQNEPVFKDYGDPVKECKKWWKGIRRALIRRCVDRIGFGGYLDLAFRYPLFLDYVEQLSDEFRTVLNRTKKSTPYQLSKKVFLLDCWGKIRSWMHNDNWPQGHIPEFLSGFAGDVGFISFDDILRNGIPDDVGVIINWGRAGSAWSGGKHWSNPQIVERVRDWVDRGGGFIGVEDPTALEHQGRFFQLADVLGVEKEIGNRLSWSKNIRPAPASDHFILEDVSNAIDLGGARSATHLDAESVQLLAGAPDQVHLSVNAFGRGRAVYFCDYLHNPQNMRLLHRSILWCSRQESALKKWFSENVNTDCAYYPEVEEFVVMNNSEQSLTTVAFDGDGLPTSLSLEPLEIKWIKLAELKKLSEKQSK